VRERLVVEAELPRALLDCLLAIEVEDVVYDLSPVLVGVLVRHFMFPSDTIVNILRIV
jgi:hypothetical protein